MTATRLDWVAPAGRDHVSVEEMRSHDEVIHYSIPNYDAFGGGVPEAPSGIESAKLRVRGGELLVSRLNPRKPRVLSTETHDALAVCSGEFVVLRPTPNANPRFLYWRLLSNDITQHLSARVQSVTRSQQRVSAEVIRKLWFDLPRLEEQQRIADYLDAETARIDELIAEQQHQGRLLDERFHIAMRERVTGRLGHVGPTHEVGPYWLGPVPSSWKPAKAGQAFSTGSGTTPPTARTDLYDGGVPWVNTSELRERVIGSTARTVSEQALDQLSALRLYPAGSVVVALYGATIGRVGILGIDATVNQACCVLHRPTTILPRFAFYWLWAHREELVALGSGGGQPNISQEIIRSIRIPTPSLDDQQDIVDEVSHEREAQDRLSGELRLQITLLKEHRQALITHAVTQGIDGLPGVA